MAETEAKVDVLMDQELTKRRVNTSSMEKVEINGGAGATKENACAIIAGFDLIKYSKDAVNFYWENKLKFKKEFLSGLTVCVMQVPESVAFSFVAGVDPQVGLYSTFFLVRASHRCVCVGAMGLLRRDMGP